jgi:hypothetical protein
MHNHGTAVLDRPAEATSAQAPSALVTSECTPDQVPARSSNNPARELVTRYDVHNLEYVELAVALYASGVRPKRFRSTEPAQIMAWAEQGLTLLGIDRVQNYARRTQFLHCRLYAKHDHNRPVHQAEYDRIWPCSFRTVQSCHDAARRLISYRPASQANPYPLQARSALTG